MANLVFIESQEGSSLKHFYLSIAAFDKSLHIYEKFFLRVSLILLDWYRYPSPGEGAWKDALKMVPDLENGQLTIPSSRGHWTSEECPGKQLQQGIENATLVYFVTPHCH